MDTYNQQNECIQNLIPNYYFCKDSGNIPKNAKYYYLFLY